MEWYYARNNKRVGPLSDAQIRELAGSGNLDGTDLVWHPGLTGWIPATEIPGLVAPPPLPRTVAQEPPPIHYDRESAAVTSETTGVLDSLATPKPDWKRSLVSSLWRGEVRLGIAYWGYGVLGSFLVSLPLLIVPVSPPTSAAMGVIVLVYAALVGAYCIFVAVAIWRSAANYRGPARWSLLAKVAVAFGLYRLVFAVLKGLVGD